MNTVLPIERAVGAKEIENLDEEMSPTESILGPVDTVQPIFGAHGFMRGITISADGLQNNNSEI